MHYFVGVILPNIDNIQGDVEAMLSPYDENEESNEETHWDWWEIGGRWDGILKDGVRNTDKPYDHYIENNIVKISDFLALEGVDDKLKQSIHKMLNETFQLPYAIVSDAEGWIEGDGYLEHSKEWEKKAIEILKRHSGEYLVCVDCHQ